MTQAKAVKHLADMGISLRRVDSEYQVKPRAASWNDAIVYFTDDLDDAVSTGEHMRWEMSELVADFIAPKTTPYLRYPSQNEMDADIIRVWEEAQRMNDAIDELPDSIMSKRIAEANNKGVCISHNVPLQDGYSCLMCDAIMHNQDMCD